ncbi:Transcription factor TFIIE alpha subunit [Zea mays]|uniref:Transcription factor TFIIE alpha subunit n=1 Tax=Zea mays TaxID=4577 RepID=A0A1D6KD15_MAIZE|nr:Transcription factor TFIIE alpha subunit [Zea mays]
MSSGSGSSGRVAPLYALEDPSLPKPWRVLVDGITGYLYYWNSYTNVTQYERPMAAPLPLQLSISAQMSKRGSFLLPLLFCNPIQIIMDVCPSKTQICDVVRYRIHRMKKKLKDELDSRNTIQHYICPSCNKRYSAFDALQLVSYTDEYFHCETCNGELVAESDKLASEEMGDGDDNVRKRRREKLKDMQQRIEEQLKPLVAQLDRVKNIPAPEFGSLQTWERANIGAFAIGDPAAADSSRNSQGQYGTPMPYIGETKVEVDLLSDGVKEGAESGKTDSELKVLPPWMIKDGMNLTKEQRGEIIAPQKLEKSDAKDDKKHDLKDDHSVQEEYIKAYYEALRKKQEEEEAKRRMQQEGKVFLPDFQTERQVGKKYKRDGDDEGIEWEEHQPTGYATETYKLADLNAEAQESGDDEDDNVWEEG